MGALHEIAALVHRESGMVIREAQLDALAATLTRIDPGCDPDESLRRLADPVWGLRRLARLVDEITVKETLFIRHAEQLEEIDWHALLRQAQANGSEKVRVWSAGCATGEEAYSLALLACEAFGTLEPPVEILATDISGTALERAEAGEYRPRSTRELDPVRQRRYFDHQGDCLIAGERLRALVTFMRHNLVSGAAPPHGFAAFDLILCRNVLIYFDTATVDRVITSLEGALRPSGALMLGAADALSRGAARLRALALAPPPRTPTVRQTRVLRRPLGRAGRPDVAPRPSPVLPTRRARRQTSCAAFRSSRPRIRTPPSPPSGGRCTPSRRSASRPSSSAAPTRRSATWAPPGEPTSRRCGRWARTATIATTRSSNRCRSTTSGPRSPPASTLSAENPCYPSL